MNSQVKPVKGQTRPVKIGSQLIGGEEFTVIGGPCSIESETQFHEIALKVGQNGGRLLRGGVFKLRTKPNSFQGLGAEAYEIVKKIKAQTRLGFVSEITDPRQVGELSEVVDAFQVGARNMHNYALLKELGALDKPVLLKRNFGATIKEWLHAADYIVQGGNDRVVLCERGIRTFETATRNTFDLNAVAYIKANTSFPVIADPSHGTGIAELVTPMALAAAAAGADGIMVEIHPRPQEALSDGEQSLNFQQFDQMMAQLRALLPALGRSLPTDLLKVS